jgi:hypothetical protein
MRRVFAAATLACGVCQSAYATPPGYVCSAKDGQVELTVAPTTTYFGILPRSLDFGSVRFKPVDGTGWHHADLRSKDLIQQWHEDDRLDFFLEVDLGGTDATIKITTRVVKRDPDGEVATRGRFEIVQYSKDGRFSENVLQTRSGAIECSN